MCGIAGIIYRDASEQHDIGRDMTRMLQSMKHRGPDSTGYALFHPSNGNGDLLLRYKLADANDKRDFEFVERVSRKRHEVVGRIVDLCADIV
jgi:glutamate synthase domain-containing protein 1